MPFDPFKKRIVPPTKTLEETIARQKGLYPEAGIGWDIPFQIFYSGKSLYGYFIANQVPHITGLPGSFLVYWDGCFQGVINYTSEGWEMGRKDQQEGAALGEWLVLYYQ